MIRILHPVASSLQFGLLATALSRTTEQAKVTGTALLDLPWEDLEGKLDSSTRLLDTSNVEYPEQCYPVFTQPAFEAPYRYHYDLLNQSSGLCMNSLWCGYEACSPIVDDGSLTYRERFYQLNPAREGLVYDFANQTLLQEWLAPSNPVYNLPPKVLFPQDAGEVVAAVNFANERSIEISVKNSGVSYIGASTKKDTLLLNMLDYKRYAIDALDGLVECDASGLQDAKIDQDLSNQACKLALARGKKATLRFGGGENWDKVYRAVKNFNEAQDTYRYSIVGGAAGPVSPQGWTWQGGLAGTAMGRMHGFGVDQVLQIEAVLPNGLHVRFGPTSWEVDDKYIYPRTTAVSGVCNENSKEDETMWVWSSCPEDINFDDLWFAIRGGWGGTFGVILSVHYQLHDYLPVELFRLGPGQYCGSSEAMPLDLLDAYWSFWIDFFLNPTALGISEEASNACATPGFTHVGYCYGDGAGDLYVAAWKKFLVDSNETLTSTGVPLSLINQAANCNYTVEKFVDYASIAVMGDPLFPDGRWSGQAHEGGGEVPQFSPPNEMAFDILVPKAWILENRKASIDLMKKAATPYAAFAGNAEFATDQTTSLSDAHYKAGIMLIFGYLNPADDFNPNLQQMYNFTGSNFPAYLGANHIGPNHRGPIKEKLSEPCPVDWTQAERDSNCVSVQEAVWGSEKLARLEAIKKTVDPNFMFDCYLCILNNRGTSDSNETTSDSNETDVVGDSDETDEETTSGSGRLGFLGALLGLLAALIPISF